MWKQRVETVLCTSHSCFTSLGPHSSYVSACWFSQRQGVSLLGTLNSLSTRTPISHRVPFAAGCLREPRLIDSLTRHYISARTIVEALENQRSGPWQRLSWLECPALALLCTTLGDSLSCDNRREVQSRGRPKESGHLRYESCGGKNVSTHSQKWSVDDVRCTSGSRRRLQGSST